MAQFPKTRAELVAAGYKESQGGNTSRCRGKTCGATIEWWDTPNGKRIPINEMPEADSPAVPHWSSCPDTTAFRR